MVMKKREHQSLFLVLSARPNWFYVARTMELPRGQTMVDQSESPTNSKDLGDQIDLFFFAKSENIILINDFNRGQLLTQEK